MKGTCRRFQSLLVPFASGELEYTRPRLWADISAHVRNCSECESEVKTIRQVGSALSRYGRSVSPADTSPLSGRVVAQIVSQQTRQAGPLAAWYRFALPLGSLAAAVAVAAIFINSSVPSGVNAPIPAIRHFTHRQTAPVFDSPSVASSKRDPFEPIALRHPMAFANRHMVLASSPPSSSMSPVPGAEVSNGRTAIRVVTAPKSPLIVLNYANASTSRPSVDRSAVSKPLPAVAGFDETIRSVSDPAPMPGAPSNGDAAASPNLPTDQATRSDSGDTYLDARFSASDLAFSTTSAAKPGGVFAGNVGGGKSMAAASGTLSSVKASPVAADGASRMSLPPEVAAPPVDPSQLVRIKMPVGNPMIVGPLTSAAVAGGAQHVVQGPPAFGAHVSGRLLLKKPLAATTVTVPPSGIRPTTNNTDNSKVQDSTQNDR